MKAQHSRAEQSIIVNSSLSSLALTLCYEEGLDTGCWSLK
jgi:hypothetical protein